MPYVPHTLVTMAEKLAEIDGGDVAEILTKLRNRHFKALLRPLPKTGGPKAALQFADEEVFRARFLLWVNAEHVWLDDLKALSDALDRVVQGKPGRPLNMTGLTAALTGIQAGEEWLCQLVYSRDRAGVRYVRAHIDSAADMQSVEDLRMIDESFGNQQRFTSVQYFRLNSIFGPLLAAGV